MTHLDYVFLHSLCTDSIRVLIGLRYDDFSLYVSIFKYSFSSKLNPEVLIGEMVIFLLVIGNLPIILSKKV